MFWGVQSRVILNGPFHASFSFIFVFSTVNIKCVHDKIFPMTRFEPRTSGMRKRPFFQPSHNHSPLTEVFCIKEVSLTASLWHLVVNDWAIAFSQFEQKCGSIFSQNDSPCLTCQTFKRHTHLTCPYLFS